MSWADLNTKTHEYTDNSLSDEAREHPCLTILYHPDPRRLGQRAWLSWQDPRPVSRIQLSFSHSPQTASQFLEDPYISRQPLLLCPLTRQDKRLIQVRCPSPDYKLTIDGEPAAAVTDLSEARIREGVVLGLGRQTVLLLHIREPLRGEPESGNPLIGQSDAMNALQKDIGRVASLNLPVLLRGETGTGKELVAQEIHRRSGRREQTFLPINMAAINPSTAASELFGHARGAFTGASQTHKGYFLQAHGGTLFLDEIGELPKEVQAMLLRVLENGEVQQVGGGKPVSADVRVIAATDSNLEAAAHTGHFTMPLFQRLNGYSIHLPPLRERRDDIPHLLLHFLTASLETLGQSERLTLCANQKRWFRPKDMILLARYTWPGNVRELRNAAHHICVFSQDQETLALPEKLRERMEATLVKASDDPPQAAEHTNTSSGPLSDEMIRDALRAHKWMTRPAADDLGIARSTINRRISESPIMRLATQLTEAEIRAALDAGEGDKTRAAEALEVSVRGLNLRIKKLGL